jgi:hypothetical protein
VHSGRHAVSVALEPFTCNRFEIGLFAKEAQALGVRYFGLCCGAMPHHIRSIAEALGASRRQAGIRRTCRSTRTSATTRGSSSRIASTPEAVTLVAQLTARGVAAPRR